MLCRSPFVRAEEFRSPYSPAQEARSRFPFATRQAYGKGQAVYVAASIFEIYWRTAHHWLRQFMEALIRHVDGAVPYEVDASALIETNLMRAGDDLLLDLIHYCLGHQGGQGAISAVERVDPVHDVPCAVRCAKADAVVLEPGGQSIEFTHDGEFCRFTVPSVAYLAIARVVGGAAG